VSATTRCRLYLSDMNTGQAKLLIATMLRLTAKCGVVSAPFTALRLSLNLRGGGDGPETGWLWQPHTVDGQ
jgi:hypothetical protein